MCSASSKYHNSDLSKVSWPAHDHRWRNSHQKGLGKLAQHHGLQEPKMQMNSMRQSPETMPVTVQICSCLPSQCSLVLIGLVAFILSSGSQQLLSLLSWARLSNGSSLFYSLPFLPAHLKQKIRGSVYPDLCVEYPSLLSSTNIFCY